MDLPFALPTAVAGIALAAIYDAKTGWVGQWLDPLWVRGVHKLGDVFPWVDWTALLGDKLAFDRPGIFIALTFIGLPFVVRTLQPVLAELQPELEEAAATLGANRWQTMTRVILPELTPALITGFAMAFARAVGEYGSVVFIAGNLPMKTEIVPLLIITKLEQYDYKGATAIASPCSCCSRSSCSRPQLAPEVEPPAFPPEADGWRPLSTPWHRPRSAPDRPGPLVRWWVIMSRWPSSPLPRLAAGRRVHEALRGWACLRRGVQPIRTHWVRSSSRS